MRSVPLVLLAVLAAPTFASGQSYFLQQASLYDGEAVVGTALHAPVVVAGASGGRVALAYAGAAVAWRAQVALAEARLQAGVGVDTVLVGEFAPRLLAGMWAPVVAMAGDGVTLGLPPGAPVRTATLSHRAPGVRGAPDNTPWTAPARAMHDDRGLHCVDLRLAPSPGAAARWQPRSGDARRLVGTANGVDTIEVAVAGFVFTGYRPHRGACPDGPSDGFGTTGGGGAADGVALGRVVVLPAGTGLFASASATRAFATLRAVSYGIEPLRGRPGRVCDAAGRCARAPAAPTGPARWIVELHDGDAAFLFDAWVHTPAEQLADAPAGHEGFGLYRSSDPAWPRAPR